MGKELCNLFREIEWGNSYVTLGKMNGEIAV